MKAHRTPVISARKHPKQARSTELVTAVLEAGLQVLATDGAQRFTMARVAGDASSSCRLDHDDVECGGKADIGEPSNDDRS